MPSEQLDHLKALVDIISTQTAVLQSVYTKNNSEVPSLDTPFQHTALEFDSHAAAARRLIIAAATQLIATMQSPVDFLQSASGGIYDTVTLGFVIDINVPEILKEAGTKGLHVSEISAAAGVDTSYLARILRYLATRHIFKEDSPDIFTHNRLSSLLIKTKSLKEIEETFVENYVQLPQVVYSVRSSSPIARFDKAAIPAFIHIASDELLNASTAFSSFIKNPVQAPAPFNIAYKTSKKMWDWLEEPANELASRKIIAVMKDSAKAMYSPDIFSSGIEGNKLKPNDTIVDVGGGVGSVTLALRKAYPELRYVVQDLDQQIAAAERFWNEKDPQAVKTGQIQLQAHDFFTPQPVKDAAVYFLRLVIHDWSDEEARKILINLRSAANAHSKLVLFEMLAKHITEDIGSGPAAPYPLLPNYGVVGGGFFTILDMALLTMYNGKERTYEEYMELGKDCGWKLEGIRPGKLSTIIFTPF